MPFIRKVFCHAVFVFAFFVSYASAYTVPEKLRYELTWAGIIVGNSFLEAVSKGENVQFSSRVLSSKWVTYFYKVEDLAVSSLKKGQTKKQKKPLLVPLNYRIEINEGKNSIHKEVNFNHAKKEVISIDRLKNVTTTLKLKNTGIDPLSGLYYIRELPLEVGKSYFVEIFNNNNVYNVEVKVLKKETIKTQRGSFNTILLKPIMNLEGEGIFFAPGELYVWVSDDEKKTPVLIKKVIPYLSLNDKNSEFFNKMPDYIKEKLSGKINTITATLIK